MNAEDLRFTLTARFEAAPEGGFTCYFEELPEVFSEGESIEAARENLFDALTQIMEYHRSEAQKSADKDTVREPFQFATV